METDKKKPDSFDEYHRQMSEMREGEKGREIAPSPKRPIAVAFGVFMVLVFVGMGVLMFINFFKWSHDWDAMRWICGFAFTIYGIFRGYRVIKGDSYYQNK